MNTNQLAAAIAFLAEPDNKPSLLRETLGVPTNDYVGTLFAIWDSPDKRAKNRAAKLVAGLAAEAPESLLPFRHKLFDAIKGDANILKWNALVALGEMAKIIPAKEIRTLLPQLQELLGDESMVSAGHAIVCLGRIGVSHRQHRDAILDRLVSLGDLPHGPDCQPILAGKVLAALEPFWESAKDSERETMSRFAGFHRGSARPSTRKLAERLLKRRSAKSS